MLSYSLHFIFLNVFFVFIPRRAIFFSVKIYNSEFAFVFVRLLKLCMRLVKMNLAQSSVASRSKYFFHQSVAELVKGGLLAFSRAWRRLRLHALASNSDWLAAYSPRLWLARLALFLFQRQLTPPLCHYIFTDRCYHNALLAYLPVKSWKVAEYFKPRSWLLIHRSIMLGWEVSTSNHTELKGKKIQLSFLSLTIHRVRCVPKRK